jgi:DNA-binding transcriptional regulator YdaS (Cro superfamily)
MDNENTIKELVEHFGSKAEMARRLGIERQNITYWSNEGVPAIQAVKIEMLTNGKFKAVDLVGAFDEQ